MDQVLALHDALLVTVKLATPLLLAALAAGVLMSLLQTVTQINDGAVAFLPKLLATAASLWLAGGFMAVQLDAFAHRIFDRLVAVGGQ